MGDPLFWLGISLLLVAMSLAAVLIVAIPTMRELSRAARSAEKLFDILSRELPPTLEALRLTGLEITGLTDDVSEGVQHAGRVVKQVDDGLSSARQQAQTLHTGTRSFLAGARAALKAWSNSGKRSPSRRRRSGSPKRMTHKPARIQPTPSRPRTPTPPVSQSRELPQANPGHHPEPPQPLEPDELAAPPQPQDPKPSTATQNNLTSSSPTQPSPLPSDPGKPPESPGFH